MRANCAVHERFGGIRAEPYYIPYRAWIVSYTKSTGLPHPSGAGAYAEGPNGRRWSFKSRSTRLPTPPGQGLRRESLKLEEEVHEAAQPPPGAGLTPRMSMAARRVVQEKDKGVWGEGVAAAQRRGGRVAFCDPVQDRTTVWPHD
jgi:hypothetical protein